MYKVRTRVDINIDSARIIIIITIFANDTLQLEGHILVGQIGGPLICHTARAVFGNICFIWGAGCPGETVTVVMHVARALLCGRCHSCPFHVVEVSYITLQHSIMHVLACAEASSS